jgi:hypothetical protein
LELNGKTVSGRSSCWWSGCSEIRGQGLRWRQAFPPGSSRHDRTERALRSSAIPSLQYTQYKHCGHLHRHHADAAERQCWGFGLWARARHPAARAVRPIASMPRDILFVASLPLCIRIMCMWVDMLRVINVKAQQHCPPFEASRTDGQTGPALPRPVSRPCPLCFKSNFGQESACLHHFQMRPVPLFLTQRMLKEGRWWPRKK